jgi:hypothetical protein
VPSSSHARARTACALLTNLKARCVILAFTDAWFALLLSSLPRSLLEQRAHGCTLPLPVEATSRLRLGHSESMVVHTHLSGHVRSLQWSGIRFVVGESIGEEVLAPVHTLTHTTRNAIHTTRTHKPQTFTHVVVHRFWIQANVCVLVYFVCLWVWVFLCLCLLFVCLFVSLFRQT